MHLHSCLISYKRRGLTQATLESYLATVSVPYSLVIVDNGSPPDVTDWLKTLSVDVLFLDRNYYPAYAANRGWERMPSETTLLHRSDNDTLFLPGWCGEMLDAFADPQVGQFGLVAAGDEQWTQMPSWPVGGNCVIRRELWDKGLRYVEDAWQTGRTEDALLTNDVWAAGYQRVFAQRPVMEYLDDGDKEYRRESIEAKGLNPAEWE